MYILGHEGKSAIFSKRVKTRLQKGQKRRGKDKNAQKHSKIVKPFTIFEKGTPGILTLATLACMKGLKYALHCIKCTSFT